jgi:hypothetical protein
VGIAPVASGLDCRACMYLRGLLDPVSGSLREQMRGFHDLLRPKPTSVHIVAMELNFNGLPNDEIHVLGLSG